MKTIKNSRLDSEMFGERGRHYFVDLLKARNDKPYLQITRADNRGQNFYERSTIIVFEEDIFFLVEALSMVLGRYIHRERKTA